jgi:hypothetical protein
MTNAQTLGIRAVSMQLLAMESSLQDLYDEVVESYLDKDNTIMERMH